jgi:raffinose/stachyose/melibiose transport system permease protein
MIPKPIRLTTIIEGIIMNIYKKWFWPLVAPALILFAAVVLVPFIVGFVNSFLAWRGTYYFNPETNSRATSFFQSFVGLTNYKEAFQDERFMNAFWYTIKYAIVAVISINVVALALAVFLDSISKGAGPFRTIFFLPNMLGGLALGFIWQFIFQIVYTDILFAPDALLHAEFLRYMTQDTTKALFALVILNVWQYAGYMMIIYTAGLNNIPVDFYEAASLDGATAWQKFRKITVPMLMSSFTICLFMVIANSFKLLDQNVALTDGDFNTRMLALQILRTTKDSTPPNYGKAQAQAVIFFVIIAIVSTIQVKATSKRELEY